MKIQFITGVHPNESFAERVAKDAAKFLTKMGITVVITRYPLKQTHLGQILQREKFLVNGANNARLYELIHKAERSLIKQEKADFVFNFHTTPTGGHWIARSAGDGKSKSHLDFEIINREHDRNNYHNSPLPFQSNEFIVEVRAAYRKVPAAVMQRAHKALEKELTKYRKFKYEPEHDVYVAAGTSLELTATNLGLDPRRLGKEIAKTIAKQVVSSPLSERGWVRRRIPCSPITAEQWKKRNERKVRLLDRLKKKK